MAQEILFTMGLEGDAEFVSQVNRVMNLVNTAFTAAMPSFDLKIGGEAEIISQASKIAASVNEALSQINIPPISIPAPQIPPPIPAPNIPPSTPQPAPFNLATASVSELQRELSKLQKQFTQGADTRNIVAVRTRLQELRIEMGAMNPQSFTQRLTSAFSESLSSATNWRDKIIQIASGNIIADLFQKIGTAIFDAGKFAIQSAGKFESIRASLDVMTGSMEKGGIVFKQFQTLAAKSPFNFDDVAEQGTKLLAMGIPIADVTNRLSRIGDVAAGVGREKLPSIVYAYGQIKSQGKAMAGDISQFINAGVPIIETLAETLKKPQEEIKKLASAGKIGFKDIDAALLSMTSQGGKFFEMMKTQSNTFEGLWSSMEDAFQLLGVAIGGKVLPIAKDIVIAISDAVSELTSFVDGTNKIDSKPLNDILTAVQTIAGMSIDALSSSFSAMSKNIGYTVLAMAGLAVAINAATIAEQIQIGVITAGNVVRTVRQFLLNQTVAISLLGLGVYLKETVAMTASNVAISARIALQSALNFVTGNWLTLLVAGVGLLTAAYAAYQIYNDATKEDAAFSKEVIDAKQTLAAEYTKERTQLDGLFSVLNNDKASREEQAKAAKGVINNYKDLLPKYVDEEFLLRKGSAAISDRNIILEELRRKTLETIASNVKAQALEGITTQLVKLEQAQQIYLDFVGEGNRSKLEKLNKAAELGLIANRLFTSFQSTAFSDQSVSEVIFSESEKGIQKLKNSAAELNKTWGSTVKNLLSDTKGVDFTSGFNLSTVSGTAADATKSVEFLQGSMEQLKTTLKELEERQNKFTVAGSSEYLKLQDSIDGVKNRIKEIEQIIAARGLGVNSISMLNIEIKKYKDIIDKTSPDSGLFESSARAAAGLESKLKGIQDRIKEFSLVSGSIEFLNFQMSKVSEQVNKQPSGSGLIPGLIEQGKELTKQLRLLRIEMGLEAPLGSLTGLGNTLSELKKQLNETEDQTLFTQIQTQIINTEAEINRLTKAIEKSKNIAAGQILAAKGISVAPADIPTNEAFINLPNAPGTKEAAALQTDIRDLYANIPATQIEPLAAVSTLPLDDLKSSFLDASNEYAAFFGMTEAQTESFTAKMGELFDQVGKIMTDGIANGMGNAAFAFGEGIGNMIMGVGTFEDAVVGSLFAMGQAFLVEIPKAIGMFLIQTAVGMMVSTVGLGLPAALPILLLGLGLVGASGVASGILGGLQKKRQQEQEGKKEIPNVNQTFGGSGAANAPSAGLSGQSAEKAVLTNVINITMPIYGLDGIILNQIQQQQIIQQELK